jgi:phosphatidylinositol kinase/protein kinase (PI-3  family)
MTASDWAKLDVRKLAATAVGAYVSNFILGVRDRHEHNVMLVGDLEADPKVMMIDFGFMLLENPGGLALDTPRLTMPPQLIKRLEEEKGADGKASLLEDMICDMITAFLALRRNANALVKLCRLMLAGV